MLNGLDLFSGYGGISIALSEWVRPVAYCEIDLYCQGVLLSRMERGELRQAPICSDVKRLIGFEIPEQLDIIYGGFPCQGISIAGLGKGLEDERSGLFFEIIRLAKQIKPSFIFLENVPAITSRGGLRVVREIAKIGYELRHDVFSAEEEGAPHKRERWFLLAHIRDDNISKFHNIKKQEVSGELAKTSDTPGTNSQIASNSKGIGMSSSRNSIGIQERQSEPLVSSLPSYWEETEPPICGMDDGPPHRLDRIRTLGNGVVPQQAKKAFKTLMGIR